ncbi:MAG TPA: hypothetical protein VG248_19680, partial [Caulobacteraceae bacterium]|nr:hypothetical protein [Caulobacteraceae bacterium]
NPYPLKEKHSSQKRLKTIFGAAMQPLGAALTLERPSVARRCNNPSIPRSSPGPEPGGRIYCVGLSSSQG